MKKANIILSAIGLLSVVGGALAFKAQHRFTGQLLCYTTVGTFINGSSGPKTYRANLITRYTTVGGVKTLFCTIPAANNSYFPVKVVPGL